MRREFSAGGVLFRRMAGRTWFAAIRPGGKPEGVWALPFLPQLPLPFLFTTDIGPAELEALSRALLDEVEALAGLPA